jgi:hypothetical protein
VAAPLAMLAISRTTAAPPPWIGQPTAANIEVNRGKREDKVPTFRQRWEPFINTTTARLNDVRHDGSRGVAIVAGTERLRSARPLTMSTPRHRVREQIRATDVCARHGMRKVTTRGGRSWRCRPAQLASTTKAPRFGRERHLPRLRTPIIGKAC